MGVDATLGVLLAGGRGRRLGAAGPKALARLGGTTLLARTRALLAELCDEVVVVAPASLALPVPAAERVCDAEPGDGPLAGVVAGLASRPFARALVLGVDFPLLTAHLLRALGGQLGDALAVLPAPDGLPQPLAAWYAPGAFAPLAASLAAGERSLLRALHALSPRIVAGDELMKLAGDEGVANHLANLAGNANMNLAGDEGVLQFLNVNTPRDLARATALLARAGAA